jgi:hypothetical protein
MDDAYSPQDGYSSEVELRLVVDGRIIPLAKMDQSFVVLREAISLPECEGEIVMSVDGRLHTWPVKLPHGAVPFDPVVEANTIES